MAAQLVGKNPGKLELTTQPTKAPAIFSSYAGGMNASSSGYGHTGLVVSIDPTTGTITTLETAKNNTLGGLSSPWSKIVQHKKEDYADQTWFVYVGDYLK